MSSVGSLGFFQPFLRSFKSFGHDNDSHGHHHGPRRLGRRDDEAVREGRGDVQPLPAREPALAAGISYQSQSGLISIVTKEGDKVTLSASSAQAQAYLTYNKEGTTEDAASSSGGVFVSAAVSSFSLTVEGNLSKEELKDVRKAIKAIGQAAYAAQRGDVDQVAQKAGKLGSLDSLSQVDASYEFNQGAIFGALV